MQWGFWPGLSAKTFVDDGKHDRRLQRCHQQLQMEYRSKPADRCIIYSGRLMELKMTTKEFEELCEGYFSVDIEGLVCRHIESNLEYYVNTQLRHKAEAFAHDEIERSIERHKTSINVNDTTADYIKKWTNHLVRENIERFISTRVAEVILEKHNDFLQQEIEQALSKIDDKIHEKNKRAKDLERYKGKSKDG